MTQDDSYRSWVGKTDSAVDFVDESRVERMYATLDVSPPPSLVGSVVPILWHWMFFAPVANFSDLGEDGHPKRGGFLPPVNLPRRMWAGGRLVFHKDLLVGTRVCRESTIKDIVLKEGRTGSMVFVTVSHVISDEVVSFLKKSTILSTEITRKLVRHPQGTRTRDRPPIFLIQSLLIQ